MIIVRWFIQDDEWRFCKDPLHVNTFLTPQRPSRFQRAIQQILKAIS